jgi:POT family proton-dependent oligopeptide transporter
MLVTGLASLFAGDFSGMVPDAAEGAALLTNPVYATLFAKLGWGATLVGIALTLMNPFLRRLINEKSKPPAKGTESLPART